MNLSHPYYFGIIMRVLFGIRKTVCVVDIEVAHTFYVGLEAGSLLNEIKKRRDSYPTLEDPCPVHLHQNERLTCRYRLFGLEFYYLWVDIIHTVHVYPSLIQMIYYMYLLYRLGPKFLDIFLRRLFYHLMLYPNLS